MSGQATVDPAVARRLAEAEIRRADADAAAERKLRMEDARATREDRSRARKDAGKQERRDDRAQRRTARRRATVKRISAAVGYARSNAPGVYSAVVYGLAVSVAVGGQISIATERGLPVVAGVGMAGFVEGLALSMALTAHQLRLRGERALLPRTLTWVAAVFAATLNAYAHREDLVLAVALGAASAVGIVVWEIRSGAKHRVALRRKGLIPQPATRFGVRRWLRYPVETLRAWSLDIRLRVSPEADSLLWRVVVRRERRQLAKVTRKAARRAARKGDAGAALAMLVRLADTVGAPLPTVPAIESHTRTAVPTPAGVPEGTPTVLAGDSRGTGDTATGTQTVPVRDTAPVTPAGDTVPAPRRAEGDTTAAVPATPAGDTSPAPTGDTTSTPGTDVVPFRRRTAVAPKPSTAGEVSTAERMRQHVLAAWLRGENPTPAELDRKFSTTAYAKRIVRDLRRQHPDLVPGRTAAAGSQAASDA